MCLSIFVKLKGDVCYQFVLLIPAESAFSVRKFFVLS